MTTTENPIMEYLHTILERTDQLVEDVTDLRHRMARMEQAVLKKKLGTHVRASSAPHKRLAHQLNAMSENPDRMKRMAKALGLCEQSILLRIQRAIKRLENSQGTAGTSVAEQIDYAEAALMESVWLALEDSA